YVVQLAISLFVTPWVLDKLGVKNAIMALPLFTLLGFVAVAINPALATALFLFIVRNGLQTGLDDPAENVLGSALPAQVGPKLNLLLDNLVLPGAAVVSGAGLYIVQQLVPATVELLALIGIVLAVLFILAALRVRSLYVTAIYERLRTHAVSLSDFQRALGRPTPAQVDELRGFISSGDDKSRPRPWLDPRTNRPGMRPGCCSIAYGTRSTASGGRRRCGRRPRSATGGRWSMGCRTAMRW